MAFCTPYPQSRFRKNEIFVQTPTPPSVRCSAGCANPSRRRLLRHACVAISSALLLPNSATSAAEKLSKLESAVVPVVMCRKIMTPVARYIEEGSWDKGRTNVNYCTRVLALRSRMKEAAEQIGGDGFYDGMEIMGEMANVMSQLDASLYTPLFVASDDGVSPEQMKYQTQARGFYGEAIDYLDRFLSIVPEETLERAKRVAEIARYEIKIETQ